MRGSPTEAAEAATTYLAAYISSLSLNIELGKQSFEHDDPNCQPGSTEGGRKKQRRCELA
jgi:hypothetical protein